MSFLDNHRGPFRFCITRPHKTKPGFHTTEWLKGDVDRDDVSSEATALLTDPRDTITSVGVWSEREQQFAGSFKQALVPRVVAVEAGSTSSTSNRGF